MIPTASVARAADFDHTHAAFAAFLEGAVSDDGVSYAILASRRPLLDAYLAGVAAADPSGFTPAEQLAFYVDAYNACTIRTVLDTQPRSVRDLDGGRLWDVRTFVVGGRPLTLNTLEHSLARPLADGRVHAALNCASKGCPPLPPAPLRADRLDAQLDEGARRWAATNAFRVEGGTLWLSPIFDWYGDDFVRDHRGDLPGLDGKAENAVWFLSRFVDEATRQRLQAGNLTVAWQDYDWSLNQR